MTPTAITIFLIAVVIAFLVGTHIDKERLKKKKIKYPKAGKAKKYSKEVNRLLEMDVDENSYS